MAIRADVGHPVNTRPSPFEHPLAEGVDLHLGDDGEPGQFKPEVKSTHPGEQGHDIHFHPTGFRPGRRVG